METTKLIKVPISTENDFIQKVACCDLVYGWLLLHSKFNSQEGYNYIYKNSYKVTNIARACRKTRKTVYNHFEKLIKNKVIIDCGEYFIIPHTNPFIYFDGKTIFGLITLPMERSTVQNIIATYVYLYKEYEYAIKYTSKNYFETSIKEVMQRLGFNIGHQSTYDHFRLIFTILDGAGLIDYDWETMDDNNLDLKKIKITRVAYKAKPEWLKMIKDY